MDSIAPSNTGRYGGVIKFGIALTSLVPVAGIVLLFLNSSLLPGNQCGGPAIICFEIMRMGAMFGMFIICILLHYGFARMIMKLMRLNQSYSFLYSFIFMLIVGALYAGLFIFD